MSENCFYSRKAAEERTKKEEEAKKGKAAEEQVISQEIETKQVSPTEHLTGSASKRKRFVISICYN